MGKKKLLLVDDDSIMAQTMSSALRHFGYEVSWFTNSLEALTDFKLHPGEFDLLIADQSMPDREGDKLVEEVTRIRPEIPVILYGYNSIECRSGPKRIRKFLVEPFSLHELGEAVRHVLNEL